MNSNYWLNDPSNFHNELLAEREVLLPYISEMIDSFNPRKILDFGCGNAYLASLIKTKSEISLYDINPAFIQNSSKWKIENKIILIQDIIEIKNNYYDVVVQSSLIMCIPTLNEISKIFLSNYTALKNEGHLIISLTHPCFLQYEYGHYKTSFNHLNFNYLKEGLEYKVYMHQKNKPSVEFTDYNWPLSTIINLLIKTGFKIKKLIEHPDLPTQEFTSYEEGCPWLFIIAKK